MFYRVNSVVFKSQGNHFFRKKVKCRFREITKLLSFDISNRHPEGTVSLFSMAPLFLFVVCFSNNGVVVAI